MEVLKWPSQSCFFLLVFDEIPKYFLILIPALVSCKGQLLTTRSVNLDFLFASPQCRPSYTTTLTAASPVAVVRTGTW